MPLQLWLLYLGVILAVIVPPGPTALLCITHGARHGWVRSVATVFGGVSAAISLMLLSALGLGALLAASDTAFQVLKWLGACYLIYLGISTWRSPGMGANSAGGVVTMHEPNAGDATGAEKCAPISTASTPFALTPLSMFSTGYLIGVSNPKDLLFFGALFPQFIRLSQDLPSQLMLLGLTWAAVETLVMLAYAAFGDRLLQKWAHGDGGRWFRRLTGAAFIVAGTVMASMGNRAMA